MRGMLLSLGIIFFVLGIYLLQHHDLLLTTLGFMSADELTGRTVDVRPLQEKFLDSFKQPATTADYVQLLPILFLVLSLVFAAASVLLPYGER